MIKNLRTKFIAVAMCSMFIVLAAIVITINITNYVRIMERIDSITTHLADNGGTFMMGPPNKPQEDLQNKKEQGVEPEGGMKPEGMSPETPFQTRYFTVTLDESGNVTDTNINNIAAINEEEAQAYAKQLLAGNKDKGFWDVYRYVRKENNNETLYIFIDCQQDISNFKSFLITSVLVSVFGLLAVFILVLIFSQRVFRPVEESYRKQKQFITDASHEIKTPLTIIDANIEVLEMETGENRWITSTRNQVKRLTGLTNQLVELSRLDEGADRQEQNEFSFTEAVVESAEPYEALARTKGKEIILDVEENIHFAGNEKNIRQLADILLDNAIKYSKDNDVIRIKLTKKGHKILLIVTNSADNLPKGDLDVLFDRFYRLDASRNSETGGTGIGLSVARAIVESHKGRISAFSEDGESIKIIAEFKRT